MKDVNPVQLNPNDRIIFGTTSVWLFRHQEKAAPGTSDVSFTFEFALEERSKQVVVPVAAAPATEGSTGVVVTAQPLAQVQPAAATTTVQPAAQTTQPTTTTTTEQPAAQTTQPVTTTT